MKERFKAQFSIPALRKDACIHPIWDANGSAVEFSWCEFSGMLSFKSNYLRTQCVTQCLSCILQSSCERRMHNCCCQAKPSPFLFIANISCPDYFALLSSFSFSFTLSPHPSWSLQLNSAPSHSLLHSSSLPSSPNLPLRKAMPAHSIMVPWCLHHKQNCAPGREIKKTTIT